KTSHIVRARRRLCSGSSYAQASNCGMRRIAVKLKSRMNRISQAGRDQLYGDQIMVPKTVTRSRKMWLRMPAAQRPQRVRYEGESHLRQRQMASVIAARSTDQIGKQINE